MNIIDILLLAIIVAAAGIAVRHIFKNKATCGCTGNCKNCSHGCGR